MRIKELFKNFALLFITIIIFMLLFEVALRLFYPQNLSRTELDEDLLFSNRADLNEIRYNRWNEFNQYISTNSHGLRDYEYPYNKSNNSVRILMLGDSFVEGVEVALENTTSKILEKRLQQLQNGIHYEVINLGVSGYGTSQELAYLEKEGLRYSPDVVVLHIFPKNDLLDNLQKDVYDVNTVSGILTKKNLTFTAFQRFWAFSIAHSHTANLIGIALLKNKNIAGLLQRVDLLKTHQFNATNVSYTRDIYLDNPSQQIIDSWGRTKIFLNRMHELAKQYQFTLIIAVIPAKEQVDVDYYKQYLEKEGLNETTAAILAPNFVLQRYMQEKGVIVVDPVSLFREKDQQQKLYFVIDGHYKEQGHVLLADVLYEKLINDHIITR
ncbi:hypothetical protein HZA96_05955 [Candidatus Woesearchaeota archaeon]|nr:hypothetical protein [Candidatus Woesearchaeota archaeon]